MPYDKFFIGPLQSGLQSDLKAWLIADDAYATLNNAYVWRGRVRKRFGSKYMGDSDDPLLAPLNSRLSTTINAVVGQGITTHGTGAPNTGIATSTVPGALFHVGQMFSIGTTIFTVYNIAAGAQQMLRSDGSASAATFDITTGIYNFVDVPIDTVIYFYPADPVMGLDTFNLGPINNHPSFAFDRQFAYTFSAGFWQRSGTNTWHSSDSQFFWFCNFLKGITGGNYMFVTNFNSTTAAPAATDDGIWYYNGTTWTNLTPDVNPITIFASPAGTSTNYVKTAKIIVAFYGRLLLLNVVEETMEVNVANRHQYYFPNRVRFSWQGDPTQTGAWLENNQNIGAVFGAGGGYLDAATTEAIVSAEFIKNRLIVYFERSTWELAYTGNQLEPFTWQKLNTELGSESTFSTVPFDKVILSVGNTGVHECNGSNVQRIDRQIPDKIFQIQYKRAGTARVQGIRDYYAEMVYWAMPSIAISSADTFPNRVLVFNYNTGTWAYNDDCITSFGYFEQQTDVTWNSTTQTWQQYVGTWLSGIQQSEFRQVIAGNQEGFVYIINADIARNAAVMQLTNLAPITATAAEVTATIINHTLHPGDYFQITDPVNTSGLGSGIFMVKRRTDDDNIVFDAPFMLAAYRGGGTVARVSNLNIQSKQWNPYRKDNKNVSIGKIDFAVQSTAAGQVTVDYSPSSTSLSMIQEAQTTNAILGNNVLETSPYTLYPLESEQDTLWHRIYFDSDGTSIQIYIYYSDAQIRDPNIAFADFQLEGLVLNTIPTSAPLQ